MITETITWFLWGGRQREYERGDDAWEMCVKKYLEPDEEPGVVVE